MRTVDKLKRWVSISEEEGRYPFNVAMEEELGYSSQAPEAEREVLRSMASDIEREMREARQREAKWKMDKAEAERRCKQLEQVAKRMLGFIETVEQTAYEEFSDQLRECGVSLDD